MGAIFMFILIIIIAVTGGACFAIHDYREARRRNRQ